MHPVLSLLPLLSMHAERMQYGLWGSSDDDCVHLERVLMNVPGLASAALTASI